ncbi:hemolysin [Candidatus Omnitrophus magneticus]|uniref:Hemolysin n=1 Tax=Candidatus Omnitrophus magneticus TaxID=1609969 RepID=A0A0F0CL23_9BACT|nr:hemolysin [Candidatus Omnitrophus magneticus]
MDIPLFIILLILSAFFSVSETAFLSLGKVRIKQIESSSSRASKNVARLLSDPNKFIITILLGNTLVNVAASSMMADIFYSFMGDAGLGLSIFLMTVILLIFGEVTPKMFAIKNAVKVSLTASFLVVIFEYLLTPVRVLLTKVSYWISKMLGVTVSLEKRPMTSEEIRSLFLICKEKGVVKEKAEEMVDKILRLKQLNVADIMTPRINVFAIDLMMDREEIIIRCKDSQFSRLPAYIHNIDNIAGIVYIKEFFLSDLRVKNFVKKPYFVPDTMRVDSLLKELQMRKQHMAVVTDEYGITAGIVTIEDILEEIVGDISDELDYEIPKVKKIDQKTYEVHGQAHIKDVNEEIGLGIETDEVDTIGGFVVLKIGHIPRAGEVIEINDFLMEVIDVSKNRVTKLRIEKIDVEENE